MCELLTLKLYLRTWKLLFAHRVMKSQESTWLVTGKRHIQKLKRSFQNVYNFWLEGKQVWRWFFFVRYSACKCNWPRTPCFSFRNLAVRCKTRTELEGEALTSPVKMFPQPSPSPSLPAQMILRAQNPESSQWSCCCSEQAELLRFASGLWEGRPSEVMMEQLQDNLVRLSLLLLSFSPWTSTLQHPRNNSELLPSWFLCSDFDLISPSQISLAETYLISPLSVNSGDVAGKLNVKQ